MTHSYCETSAYLRCADSAALAVLLDQIRQLFAAEGMQQLPPGQLPANAPSQARAHQNRDWSLSITQGKAGWVQLRSTPFDLLCETAENASRMRFLALAYACQAAGFLVSVADGSPWGQVLVETDGKGQAVCHGWWQHVDFPDDSGFYGQALLAPNPETWPEGKSAAVNTLLANSRDSSKCKYQGDSEMEVFCLYVAQKLVGMDAHADASQHPPGITLHFSRSDPGNT